jgi:hypothetical protein
VGKFKNKKEYDEWKKGRSAESQDTAEQDGIQDFPLNTPKRKKMSSSKRNYILLAVITVFIIYIIASNPQHTSDIRTGAYLKGGYASCASESLIDEFSRAKIQKDERALNYLLQNGCIISKPNVPISVLDITLDGKVQVRAYVGDSTVILWTYRENIQ